MTLDDLNQYLGAIGALMSIGAMFVAWLSTRRKDVDRRFEEGSKRMDRHDLRLQSLEDTAKVTPGKDELHEVRLELARMAGSLQGMQATMEGNANLMGRLESIVSRHEDHLLAGGKR